MDLFFTLSKLAWVALAPSTALVLIIVVGLALGAVWPKATLFGRRVAIAAAVAWGVLAFTPAPNALLAPLEQRFPPLDDAELKLTPLPVAGIIVLGGGVTSVSGPNGYRASLTESADRLREAAWLARAFPQTPVVLAGGTVFGRPGEPTEAILMAEVLAEFGVPRARLKLEDHSRTTAENAAEVAEMARGGGAWILVTSAYHMPRAVATFQANGVRVIPAPTDWRLDAERSWLQLSASQNLILADLAAKEWLGLVGYRISGRTKTLFPKPVSLIDIAEAGPMASMLTPAPETAAGEPSASASMSLSAAAPSAEPSPLSPVR